MSLHASGVETHAFRDLDPELSLLCTRAYNDFLLEWAGADPARLLPVIATPFWDVPETVAEITRAIDGGARGVLFTGEPQRYGLPYLGDTHWDPMWAVTQEAGIPVHFHIGNAGELPEIMTPERLAAHGHAATQTFAAVDLFMKNGVGIAVFSIAKEIGISLIDGSNVVFIGMIVSS